MKRALAFLVVLGVGACGKGERRAIDHERSRGVFDEIKLDAPPGMSGLAMDDQSVLWGIPERDRFLVEIRVDKDKALTRRYPLRGVPDGVDTEGLAWLSHDKFAVTTEGAHAPSASILYVERQGDAFVVTRTRTLTSAELGVELTANHGAEGACGHGDDVLVALEAVGTLPDGARYAPIAWLRGDALTIYKVRLTSKTGKLSSIDCSIDLVGVAHVWAIERHYGICRILRFDIAPTTSEIVPTIDLDLSAIINDALNLEGIVALPDGRLVLINDNQGTRQDGPNELLMVHPR